MDRRRMWHVVGLISGLAAGAATRWLLVTIWTRVQGSEPPTDPPTEGSSRTTWPEALAWAVASGAALAITRLVARRGAAEAWKAATGSYPEDLDPATV